MFSVTVMGQPQWSAWGFHPEGIFLLLFFKSIPSLLGSLLVAAAGPRLLLSSSLMRILCTQSFSYWILLSIQVSCPLTCERGSKVKCRVIPSCRTWAEVENLGCFMIQLQLVFSLLSSGFLACFIAVSGKSIFLLPATKQYMCFLKQIPVILTNVFSFSSLGLSWNLLQSHIFAL